MKRWKRNSLGVIAAGLGVMLGVGPASAESLVAPDSGPIAGGTSVTLPALPDATVKFLSLVTGGYHALAVASDGNTYAWGLNDVGQVGIGTTTDVDMPTRVETPAGVTFTSVAAGYFHSVAVGSDGNVYAWGWNADGQVGNGSTENVAVPTRVETPAGVTFTSVSAGYFHSVEVGSDGNTYAWGSNAAGQIGNGSSSHAPFPTPVEAPDGVTFAAVYSGAHHSLAVGSDGNTYGWGGNHNGQLGNGGSANARVPTLVEAPAGVTFTSAAAGRYHSLAVGSDGNTYGWGNNRHGELGNGGFIHASVPTLVTVPAGVTLTAVAAGGDHSLAVGPDGSTYAWGGNGFGQLGNGGNTDASVPTLVAAPAGARSAAVVAGDYHSLALGPDGNVSGWGDNFAGQLGNGSTTDSRVPTPAMMPEATSELAQVLFGGVPASDAVVNEDGTITATTPESPVCGPVDVTVEWTANGVAQDPIVYEGGFTYEGEYALTAPEDQTVKAGADASFTTGWTVCDGGVPSWEVSLDGGETWVDAATLPGVTVSGDGLTVTVTATGEVHGALVRATGRDGDDAVVVSDAAVLTLAPSTVTFDTKGGNAIDAVTVPYGDLVKAPKDPSREGYTFTGWYTDAAGATEWDFTKPVTTDVTLYAGWEKVTTTPPTSEPPTTGPGDKPGNGGSLPMTGGAAVWGAAGVGVLAVAAGIVLVLRRRHTAGVAE